MSWDRTRRIVSIIDMVEVATVDMATVDKAMDITETVKARPIGVRCGHDDQEAKSVQLKPAKVSVCTRESCAPP